jgi:hypothetical protein
MGFGNWCSNRWNNVKSGAAWAGGKVANGTSYVYNKAVDGTAVVLEKGLDVADHFTSSGHGATNAFVNNKTVNNLADAGEFIQHGDRGRVAHAIFQGTKDGFGEVLALPGDIVDLGNMGVKKITGHGYDGSAGDWISKNVWDKPTDAFIDDVSTLAGHEIKPFVPQTNGEAWTVGAYKAPPVIASFLLPGGAGKVGKLLKPFATAAKDSKVGAVIAKTTAAVAKPLEVVTKPVATAVKVAAKPVETAVKTAAKVPGVTPAFKTAGKVAKFGIQAAMPVIYGAKEGAAFQKRKAEANSTLEALKSVDALNASRTDKVLAEHNIPTGNMGDDEKHAKAKTIVEAEMTQNLKDLWRLRDPQNADKIGNAVDGMSVNDRKNKLQELLALPDPQVVPVPAVRPPAPASMGVR